MALGIEKLEQCGYPTVKKYEDMFTRFDRIHERDGDRQTNRHRSTTQAALMHSIARQKQHWHTHTSVTKSERPDSGVMSSRTADITNPTVTRDSHGL